MVDFKPPAHYDRVVSVEMFEHMKNYQELLGRVASWLKPGGKLFVHIFVHKEMPYHYEVRAWLGTCRLWPVGCRLYLMLTPLPCTRHLPDED
jgi:cyclopropane fatty-acyl-phospholipid synthase-like methyltransferase